MQSGKAAAYYRSSRAVSCEPSHPKPFPNRPLHWRTRDLVLPAPTSPHSSPQEPQEYQDPDSAETRKYTIRLSESGSAGVLQRHIAYKPTTSHQSRSRSHAPHVRPVMNALSPIQSLTKTLSNQTEKQEKKKTPTPQNARKEYQRAPTYTPQSL